ncbi:MAG: hypothetical protein QMD85_01145 [Candidatus Aenigmarchaeota archaeon]|nr:hypothetical protein [Candidatus Aenigmarchaeota archaeon]MDI6722144.1 hypothetical protein [Candidatus Aenigmarchaeota archaeon]
MNTENLDKYKKMQEEVSLPHLNELKEKFKFEVEEDDKIFDNIRTEMSERLFMLSERIIEPVIGGAESFSCIFEQNMVNESERQELFNLYKKIQMLKWENNMLLVSPDEKKIAAWIKKTWELWNSEMQEKLLKFSEKMSSGWGDLKFRNKKSVYLG